MKRFIALVAVLLLAFASPLFAAPSNHDFFTQYDCASLTYVFNESAEATPGNAEQIVYADWTHLEVFFDVETLNSTSVTFIILGRVRAGAWMEIYTKQYTAATTYAEPVKIGEMVDRIAVGILVAGDAADDSFSASMIWR